MTAVPSLTIRQVRVVDAVATHASLARASEHLHTSQSTLSRSIADAERVLGQRLFQRGWAGMEATSQGEIVVAHCRRMIANIERVQQDLHRSGVRAADLGHRLTWDMLAVIDAVRLTGGVSKAASYLDLSQPDVSRSLARVAAAVGRPVFRRTRAGMAPTEVATALLDLRNELLADVMSLPGLLDALHDEVTGRVAVGLLPFSEQDVVVKAFGTMLRRHRHVRLQAVTGSYAALIEGLRRGELDFVIGPLRDRVPGDALEEMPLVEESFAMVARADHPRVLAQTGLEALAEENWVVAPHGTPTRRYFEQLLMAQGLTPPAQTCEMVTFSLAEQMILNSDAIGLLTYSDAKRRALRNGLAFLPVLLPGNTCRIGLTFRKHVPFTDAQKTFIETLTAATEAGLNPRA